MNTQTQFISIAQLASILSIAEERLELWMERGVLPDNCYIKIDEILRFDLDLVLENLVTYNGEPGGNSTPKRSMAKMPSEADYLCVAEMAVAFAELSDKCLEQLEDIFEYLYDCDLRKESAEIDSLFGGLLLPEAVLTEIESIRDWMIEESVPTQYIDDLNRLLCSFREKYLNEQIVERLKKIVGTIDWHYEEGYSSTDGPLFAKRVRDVLGCIENKSVISDQSAEFAFRLEPPMLDWSWNDCLWQSNRE